MSNKSSVYFTQTLNLSINRVFNAETATVLEREYYKVWDKGYSKDFDFSLFSEILIIKNLNPFFVKDNHFEIIKFEIVEPKTIKTKNLKYQNFLNHRINFKFYTKKYKVVNPNDKEKLTIENTTLKIEQTLFNDFLHNAELLPHFD